MSMANAGCPTLEEAITAIEQRLAALGLALRDRDAHAIELHSQALHHALSSAIQRFSHAAREPGGVAPALRQRLVMAGGQVAAQRESLARATAALDRAIEVLMPGTTPPAAYAAHGGLQRPTSSHCVGT
jgi:hypothetical protein